MSLQRMLGRDQEAAALAAAETEPGLLVQRAGQLMRRGDLATALAVLDTAVTVLTNKQGNIWESFFSYVMYLLCVYCLSKCEDIHL